MQNIKTYLIFGGIFILIAMGFLIFLQKTNALNLGATLCYPNQGCTGIGSTAVGNIGKYLKVSNNSPFTYTFDTPAGGSGSLPAQLGQIGDVSTSSPMTYGEVLRYNTATSEWESVATSTLGFTSSLTGSALTKGYFIVGDDAGLSQATSSIFVSSTGNVGIGTNNPINKLQVVNGDINIATDGYALRFGGYYTFSQQAGYLTRFSTGGAGGDYMIFTIGSSEKLRIIENGNVGIGTTSPYAMLSVAGQTVAQYFTATSTSATSSLPLLSVSNLFQLGTASYLRDNSTSTLSKGIDIASGCFAINGVCVSGGGGGTGTVSAGTTNRLAYYAGLTTVFSANFLTVDTTYSRLGIGTSSPNWDLQIASTSKPFLVLSDMSASGDAKHWFLSNQGGNLYIGTSSSALNATTTYLTIQKDTGNVGIGTTSPAEILSVDSGNVYFDDKLTLGNYLTGSPTRLDVWGQSIFRGKWLFGTDGAGGVGQITWGNSPLGMIMASGGSYPLYLGTNNDQDAFTILTNGNVGIGTTSPWAKLSVWGESDLGNYALAGYFTATSTTATSTISGNLWIKGYLQIGTGSSYLTDAATSTLSKGINLTSGCFAINGACVSGGAAGGTVTSVATTYPITGGTITTSGTLSLAFGTTTSNTWAGLQTFSNVSTTLLTVGVNDTTKGVLTIFGDNADSGAILYMYNSANEDATQDYWALEPQGTNFWLGVDDNPDTFIFSNAGNFTALGNVAGATYGSDASITNTELLYINTLSSNAQTQLTNLSNTKQNGLNFNPFSAGYFTATSTGTSTFANISSWGLLSASYVHSTSTATSTFAGGINMTSGCFAINNTCVSGGGGSASMATLTDVSLGALAWGDMLYFDSGDLKWKDMATSSIGFPTDLDDLTDVVIASPANGHILVYNDTPPPAQWNNVAMSNNCTITTAGVITCFGGTIGSAETTAEDWGSFSCTGAAGGCTVDALAISNAMLANSTISGVALGSNLANLTATDTTLTFSGTYTGAAARTIGLNLGNANSWTARQTFTNASSTNISSDWGGFITASSTYLTIGYSLDAGGAASFEIPNGSPTVDTTGEIGIDTTSGQFKWSYNGVSLGILEPWHTLSFNISSSSWGTGTTTIGLAPASAAITIVSAQCETSAGTLNVSLYDGTNRANLLNASTTIGTYTYATNNTFTAGESMRADVGTAATSPTWLACRLKYTFTAD